MFDLRRVETPDIVGTFNHISKTLTANLHGFEFCGVKFGALCSYDARLMLKTMSLNEADPVVFDIWKSLIMSAVKMYLLTKEAAANYNINQILYFNDYSASLAARLGIESMGGSASMVTQAYHMSIDRRLWVFNNRISLHTMHCDKAEWPQWRELPLPANAVKAVADDVMFRFGGRSAHIYSPPWAHAQEANVEVGSRRPRIVVFTSSPDELALLGVLEALELSIPPITTTFGTTYKDCHVAWLDELKQFALNRPSYDFVIRVHPREGSNKREPIGSQHLGLLKQCLSNVPSNMRVHWPEDPVSSYNLGEKAHLVLTSWSTIGLEMARLGIPVLSCAPGLGGFPADSFLQFTESKKTYFAKIDQMLSVPASLENVRLAYRLWHFLFLSGAIDLSDLIPSHDFVDLPPYKRPSMADAVVESALGNYSQRKHQHQKLKDQLSSKGEATAVREETEALKRAICRIIAFILTGDDSSANSRVSVVLENALLNEQKPDQMLVFKSGDLVTARHNGQLITRDSPLISRLCSMLVVE